MTISQIAAMSKNRVIGKDGDLPWSLPEDLKYFKEKTKDHIILMGRKTFESLPKPLPHRLNVVVSRQKDYTTPEDVPCFSSIESALTFCKGEASKWGDKIFIIGGGQIYKQTMSLCHSILLTEIDKDFEGDATFPNLLPEFSLAHKEDRYEPMPYSFCTYINKNLR